MDSLVTIVGATGTGKSKLAVDLACRFNGEIINGDAMQMYRGLPIITNQIPIEERNGVPHHLISCIELEEEPWRVGLFKNECLRLIKDVHARGKLPILVGGTHYYTQAVLFKDQLVGELAVDQEDGQSNGETKDPSTKWPILDASPDAVLQKLREVDPVMAERWHPNETRKIRRSLEIYFQTGKPASEVYAAQKRAKQSPGSDGNSVGAAQQLRFQTVILWVHSDKETLNTRLDKRVDAMIADGLMSEAQQMTNYLQEKKMQGVPVNHTRGVWISIGFKELAPYFEALYSNSLNENELEALKRSCIEQVKIATRQYSVSQIKWVRNKLWGALAEAGMTHRLFLLDSTNVDHWVNCITEPSELLVHSLLRNEPTPDPKSLSDLARNILGAKEAQSPRSGPRCITCDICKKTMINQEQWEIHIKGQVHRRILKSAAQKAHRDEYLRKQQNALEKNIDHRGIDG
ncbi:hypothetical protein EYZ11_012541 [Aspergillus tanneri]|uniref:tRNA dimethylallyltransferase n=1 Tax=Aspergillus tanneri TaxID=1220188 RepID=A0A4S3J0J7_9EURO|nr:uncharacterized protein ATNIH1004_009959 [Aspergillus tanneri]KAA8643197.1 hypothetical protein ATNIH1004_009959 [Aspergillus tanneri]THC88012.1 hypothetical protein EYZ11_012541 [Aspergillus tanneri]